MLASLVVYIFSNIIFKVYDSQNDFNDFLENIAIVTTFGLTTIIYGILIYKDNVLILFVLLVYAMSIALSTTRNQILHLKNTQGLPVALNGLFFPLLYYFYSFYLGKGAQSVFVAYYIVVSILSISHINFIGIRRFDTSKDEFEHINEPEYENKPENKQKNTPEYIHTRKIL